MRTLEFSRHNTLLCVEGTASLDIPDAMKCRASYTIFSVRGKTSARLIRIERDVRGTWVTDRLPTLERQALEAHIERLFDEDAAEDARNVREVAEGFV